MATNSWSSIQNINNWSSGETSSLFNLIIHQKDIDKKFLYAKVRYEAKYQLLINKREGTDLKRLNDCKALIEYLNDMNNTYWKIEEYNPNNKCKILIAFLWFNYWYA